jgi:outer membrane protein OmpA-like peptidoglycan-associated protein
MVLKRIAVILLAGTALAPFTGGAAHAAGDGVTVNMDALGPEPAKKPTPKPAPAAVQSETVPDPAPMAIGTPQPAPPKPKPKPAVVPARTAPAQTGEIDFISKTKNAMGQSTTTPAAAPPPSAPIAVANPAPLPAPVPAQPKKKERPATVVVDTGGLEGDAAPGAKPQGTPLTSLQPDGALFVPKNVEALPQPVDVPQPAKPEDAEDKPLTLPPAMPVAPAVSQPSAAIAPSAAPAAKAPPSTQSVAAVAPVAPAAQQQARASVLSGLATAAEVRFDPGLEILTPEAQAALDQIVEPLKAAALRVQLAAYSGAPGNNSSETRRLSLKRALAVRDYLDSRGVPKLTVNIAAFGGATQGQSDRVDVMVRNDQLSKISTVQ